MKCLKSMSMRVVLLVAVMLVIGLLTCTDAAHAGVGTTIVEGKTYSGAVYWKTGYVDKYVLNVKETGNVKLNVKAEPIDDSLAPFWLKVYDQNERNCYYSIKFERGESTRTFSLKKGTYILKIAPDSIYDTKYTFSTKFISSNETFDYTNDFISDLSSRSAVPYRTKINCQLSAGETFDYYKISVPGKGRVTLDLTTDISQAWFILTDKNGDRVSGFYGEAGKSYSVPYNLAKGTYYLKVEKTRYAGNYNFKLSYSKDAISSLAVKKVTATSMRVTANKAGAISGYEIKYRRGSGEWKTVTVQSSSKLSKTIKGLSRGATYKVKMRTYYTYKGKKIYSNWSGVKSVKLK